MSLLSSINDGRGLRVLLTSPNRLVVVMDTAFKYEVVRITRSDPADPVRDLRLWAPITDGAGLALTATSDLRPGQITGSLEPAPGAPEPLFHPTFLEHLRQAPDATVLRFLTWFTINGISDETPTNWSDRTDADAAVRGVLVIDRQWGRHPVPAVHVRLGYPYEWAIALCNAVGRDLWIQVPHTATDDLVRNLARLIARTLRPDLRVWAEYSNEIWNSAPPYLPQRQQAMSRAATHFGVAPAALTFAQIAWGAGQLQAGFLRTFEAEWRAQGQGDARLVNVVGGFSAVPGYNHDVIASMREVEPALPEVLAVSNYFGLGTQGDIFHRFAFGVTPGRWPASLYDDTAAIVRRDLNASADTWTQCGRVAREFSMPLVAYEGGQHMLPLGYGDWSDPVSTDFMHFMYDFQRSPQMGALYREQYALWSAAGGRTPSLWMDIGTWSFWGYWGAKEFVGQTRRDSAKWDAYCAWGETQRGVRAPYDPVLARPVLQPATLHGEESIALDASLAALGGDGAVALSLLGGQLPPGVELRPDGTGRARITGTPRAFGLYRFVVRALDADGDADDRRYDLTVDPAGTRDRALFVFRGADLPASPLASGDPNGRYDPTRRTQVLDGGARLCVPFSMADGQALFAREFVGSQMLTPTSALTMYGGWCLAALPSATRVGAPNLNSWTGLRQGQFVSWVGDLTGPAAFDAMLAWRSDQFAPFDGAGPYAFGIDAPTSTLQVDLRSLVGDGTNELRFAVLNHDAGGDAWYLSEAAFTDQYLGDGAFRLQRFSGSSEVGHRWATFAPPVDTNLHVNTAGLTFTAKTFDDVRAVGLIYRGTRWQWNFSFAFDRAFALGERR